MGLQQDIHDAEVYIARANKRIAKERGLISRSRNLETVATARDLVVVLSTLLASVERRHQQLQVKRLVHSSGD